MPWPGGRSASEWSCWNSDATMARMPTLFHGAREYWLETLRRFWRCVELETMSRVAFLLKRPSAVTIQFFAARMSR